MKFFKWLGVLFRPTQPKKIKIGLALGSGGAKGFAELGALKAFEENGIEYIHVDIMDGHFVPNLSYSAVTVKALRPYSNLVFDVHLMIENQGEKCHNNYV